ncbi:MAG: hypothetical protein EA421_07705 [Gemmatimonadales bacterium]|nr:MAG: hypothetical protein EA421_07705 [Gemmatimonadales bacterium]
MEPARTLPLSRDIWGTQGGDLTSICATAQLMATVRDADGVEMPTAAVTWSSSNTAVATVGEGGTVEAVGEGSTTITAQSGDATGNAQVTVVLPAPTPAEVVVEPDTATLTEVGATVQLSATVLDATGAEIGATAELAATVLDADGVEIEGAVVVWTTSDAEVAVVDQEGVVTAVGEGVATITAAIGEVSGTAEVTVEL